MDPASIAVSACSLAKFTFETVGWLHEYRQNVENVNKMLVNLIKQFEQLGMILKNVDSTIRQCENQSVTLGFIGEEPWIAIKASVDDCATNVESVHGLAKRIYGNYDPDASRLSRLAKKTSMHFHYVFKAGEVEECLRNINWSTLSMQLSMQMITTAGLVRANASQDLLHRELQTLRTDIIQAFEATKNREATADAHGAKQARNLRQLVATAKEIHKEASTMTERAAGRSPSPAGGRVMPSSAVGSVPTPPVHRLATPMSVWSDRSAATFRGGCAYVMPESRRRWMEEWNEGVSPTSGVSDTTADDDSGSERDDDSSAPTTPEKDEPTPRPGTKAWQVATPQPLSQPQRVDSGALDTEREFLEDYEDLAHVSFIHKDYAKAEQCLRLIVERATGDIISESNLRQVRVQLALCCCLQEKWDHAGGILESLGKTRSDADLPKLDLLQAVALARVEQGRLRDANALCKSALSDKNRLLGNDSEDYLLCRWLYSAIVEKQGKVVEAEATRRSIPQVYLSAFPRQLPTGLHFILHHSRHFRSMLTVTEGGLASQNPPALAIQDSALRKRREFRWLDKPSGSTKQSSDLGRPKPGKRTEAPAAAPETTQRSEKSAGKQPVGAHRANPPAAAVRTRQQVREPRFLVPAILEPVSESSVVDGQAEPAQPLPPTAEPSPKLDALEAFLVPSFLLREGRAEGSAPSKRIERSRSVQGMNDDVRGSGPRNALQKSRSQEFRPADREGFAPAPNPTGRPRSQSQQESRGDSSRTQPGVDRQQPSLLHHPTGNSRSASPRQLQQPASATICPPYATRMRLPPILTTGGFPEASKAPGWQVERSIGNIHSRGFAGSPSLGASGQSFELQGYGPQIRRDCKCCHVAISLGIMENSRLYMNRTSGSLQCYEIQLPERLFEPALDSSLYKVRKAYRKSIGSRAEGLIGDVSHYGVGMVPRNWPQTGLYAAPDPFSFASNKQKFRNTLLAWASMLETQAAHHVRVIHKTAPGPCLVPAVVCAVPDILLKTAAGFIAEVLVESPLLRHAKVVPRSVALVQYFVDTEDIPRGISSQAQSDLCVSLFCGHTVVECTSSTVRQLDRGRRYEVKPCEEMHFAEVAGLSHAVACFSELAETKMRRHLTTGLFSRSAMPTNLVKSMSRCAKLFTEDIVPDFAGSGEPYSFDLDVGDGVIAKLSFTDREIMRCFEASVDMIVKMVMGALHHHSVLGSRASFLLLSGPYTRSRLLVNRLKQMLEKLNYRDTKVLLEVDSDHDASACGALSHAMTASLRAPGSRQQQL